MQPAALPAPDEPGTWDDLKQPKAPPHDPGSRSPPPDHRARGRSPQGRLQRRSAAGLLPVLDLPAWRAPRQAAVASAARPGAPFHGHRPGTGTGSCEVTIWVTITDSTPHAVAAIINDASHDPTPATSPAHTRTRAPMSAL